MSAENARSSASCCVSQPLLKRGRVKHALASEKLVKDKSERENVRLRGECPADNLLRGHVRWRPRNRFCLAVLRGHGESEIGEASMPATVDHDIGRLQIAMQDSLVVRCRQSGTQLARDFKNLLVRESPNPLQQGGEVFSIDVLH